MGKGKDQTNDEKPKIIKLFSEGMSTLKISKELSRDHQVTTNAVYRTTRSQGKSVKNLLPRDERKLK